jgi:two-component system sensor histidine kinase YesM
MVDEGEIEIRIDSEKDDIIFSVRDNGVGMSEKQCEDILYKEGGRKSKTGVGIGIKNVNDRIKIYFGEEYGITIESVLDEGTTVTMRIPKLTEEEYYEKHYHENIGE